MQLRKFGIKFQRIDIICISHLHGDHYFGLIGLLSTMHLMGRTSPIKIFGPVGLKEILHTMMKYGGSQFDYDLDIHEIKSGFDGLLFEDNLIQISCFPLKHKIPTSGYLIREKEKERHLLMDLAKKDNIKIEYFHLLKKGIDVRDEEGNLISFEKYTMPGENPLSYAFCSDTKYTESIIPFIENVDCLYHEATFTEKFIDRAVATMHSTAGQAATIAHKASVGKLLMGHFSARFDNGEEHLKEAKAIFPRCIIVEDGETYEVD